MAIVDDGLDFNHPDVKDNYASVGSTDVNFHKADPMPFSFDGHGTSAAGCSSAIANNAQCGVGTAPESKISGIRLIAESTTDVDEAEGCSFFFFFFVAVFSSLLLVLNVLFLEKVSASVWTSTTFCLLLGDLTTMECVWRGLEIF